MIFNILVLVILIFINGLFSATEIALLSIDKYELNKQLKKGNKKAKKISNLLNNSSLFLAAIQIAITLAGFLASAFAAESFADELASLLSLSFINLETLTNILIIVITIVLSYFTLVFGELVPKKIGMAYPNEVAYKMVNTINTVIKIFYPFIKLLTASTNFITKIFKIKKNVNEISERQIKETIIDASEKGLLEEFEKKLLLNTFQFNDTLVKDIMTSKNDCIMININSSLEEIKKVIIKTKYTRFPVYKGDDNHIIGILNVKDLILKKSDGERFEINNYLRSLDFIEETSVIDDAFFLMRSKSTGMLVVRNKKEVVGIVTMEDIVEEIVGDIYDEYDQVPSDNN